MEQEDESDRQHRLAVLEKEFKASAKRVFQQNVDVLLNDLNLEERIQFVTRLARWELERFYQPRVQTRKQLLQRDKSVGETVADLPQESSTNPSVQTEDDATTRPSAIIYLWHFPFLRNHPRSVNELAIYEYSMRICAGEWVEIDEFLEGLPKSCQMHLSKCCHELHGQISGKRKPADTPVDSKAPTVVELPEPSMDVWSLPKLVDSYFISDHISSGGMGTVFAGIDVRSGATVALKFSKRADAWSVTRFSEEMRVLTSLSHPGLVEILDSGEFNGSLYYTMPLLQGLLLDQWFARVKEAPDALQRLSRVVRRLASTITYIHHRGFLHGDIKPSNVFVLKHDRVKLVDLGLAANQSHTVSSECMKVRAGTVGYIAPEVNSDRYLPESDWYAFGITLMECLLGESIADSKLSDLADSIQNRWKDHPESTVAMQLLQLSMKLTATNPVQRPTASEINGALAQFDEHHPSGALQFLGNEMVGRQATLEHFYAWLSGRLSKRRMMLISAVEGSGANHLLRHIHRERSGSEHSICLYVDARRLSEHRSLNWHLLQEFASASRRLQAVGKSIQKVIPPREFVVLSDCFPQIKQLEELVSDSDSQAETQLKPSAVVRRFFDRVSEHYPVEILVSAIDLVPEDDFEMLSGICHEEMNCRAVGNTRVLGAFDQANEMPFLRRVSESLSDSQREVCDLPPMEFRDLTELAKEILSQFNFHVPLPTMQRLVNSSQGLPGRLVGMIQLLGKGRVPIQNWMLRIDEFTLMSLTRIKLERLDKPSRTVVELLAVSGGALGFRELALASRYLVENLGGILEQLSQMGVVRATNYWPDYTVELCHTDFQVEILRGLDAEKRKRRHYHLARAFQKTRFNQPEQIGFHYRMSGNIERAAAFERP